MDPLFILFGIAFTFFALVLLVLTQRYQAIAGYELYESDYFLVDRETVSSAILAQVDAIHCYLQPTGYTPLCILKLQRKTDALERGYMVVLRHAELLCDIYVSLLDVTIASNAWQTFLCSNYSDGAMCVTSTKNSIFSAIKNEKFSFRPCTSAKPAEQLKEHIIHRAENSSSKLVSLCKSELVDLAIKRDRLLFNQLISDGQLYEYKPHVFCLRIPYVLKVLGKTLFKKMPQPLAQQAKPATLRDELRFDALGLVASHRVRQILLATPTYKKAGFHSAIFGVLILCLLTGPWFTVGLYCVLLLHELGHMALMHLSGYRGISLQFVPLLGAYVTGFHDGVSAWRRALVLLAGPVPGIILGLLITMLGVVLIRSAGEMILTFGLLMLFINYFNLLPLKPLDGGKLWELIACEGRPKVLISFELISILGLLAIAYWTMSPMFLILALIPAIAVSKTRNTLLADAVAKRLSSVPLLKTGSSRVEEAHLLVAETINEDEVKGLSPKDRRAVLSMVATRLLEPIGGPGVTILIAVLYLLALLGPVLGGWVYAVASINGSFMMVADTEKTHGLKAAQAKCTGFTLWPDRIKAILPIIGQALRGEEICSIILPRHGSHVMQRYRARELRKKAQRERVENELMQKGVTTKKSFAAEP